MARTGSVQWPRPSWLQRPAALAAISSNGTNVSDTNPGQFPDPWAPTPSNNDSTGAFDPQAFPAPPGQAPDNPQPQTPYGQPPPAYGAPPAPGSYVPPPQPGYSPTPAGYGPPPGAGVPQPYGQPGYPQPAVYAAQQANSTPASTIVLLILSALATLSCYGFIAGIPPLVLSIVALTKSSTDPEGCRKLTNIGWIVFGVLLALYAAAIVILVVSLNNNTY